jgi:hypothetical protein
MFDFHIFTTQLHAPVVTLRPFVGPIIPYRPGFKNPLMCADEVEGMMLHVTLTVTFLVKC